MSWPFNRLSLIRCLHQFLLENGFKAYRIIAFIATMDFSDEGLLAEICSPPPPPLPYMEPGEEGLMMLLASRKVELEAILEEHEKLRLAAAPYVWAPPHLLPVAPAPIGKRKKSTKGSNPHARKIMTDRLRRARLRLHDSWKNILGPGKTDKSDWEAWLEINAKVTALQELCDYFK
jgi:hypothetical protein